MAALDALLSDVREADVPLPSKELMARIAADAEAVRGFDAVVPSSGWRVWLDALGGWPAFGGLATAGIAGLWIGVSPPAAIDDVYASVFGETVLVEMLPAAGLLGMEVDG